MLGLAVAAALSAISMTKAFDHSLNYARRMAGRYDLLDPRRRAYDDMVTEMTLAMDRDGRRMCREREAKRFPK